MNIGETVLRLEHIKKTFSGVHALSDMSFELKKGEIHAICGENGAGKSTLMKVVCGAYRPDSGDIYVNGSEAHFSNPIEAYQAGISIIFQETSLFEEMTVRENLFLGHEPQKKVGPLRILDYKDMTRRAEEIFLRLNSKINLNTKIKKLGIAQKQMVEIAKALTFNAHILILDEPSAALTQREVDALFHIISQLRDDGLGIVYISHRLEEIFEICDRVTVIRDGMYISTKNVNHTNKDELVTDMVGRSLKNYYPKCESEIQGEYLRVEHLYDNGFLTDISFSVNKGEIVGFAGLAGAGRTELMEAICGLSKKLKGSIALNGEELHIDNYRQAKAAGLVYVSEDRGKYGLVSDLTIAQNVSMPQLDAISKYGLISKKKERILAQDYMEKLGIKAPDAEFVVSNLSGGNQQKVSVSKALALKPKVLILDEPTRGVDVNAKAEIMRIISELTKVGLTILMVSSELPELLGMCDRIYVMKEGLIVGCFNREEACQEKILKIALDI